MNIAYFPKEFTFSETKLSENTQTQIIPIKRDMIQLAPQFNIGVRVYSQKSKGWRLSA